VQADTILTNAKIYTAAARMPWAEAVAFAGKRIEFVGNNKDCLLYAGKGTQVIDLGGKTVLPGLLDGHTHPTTVAKTIWHIRMPMTRDKDTLLATIREYAQKYPKEDVPYFFGDSYYAEIFGSEGPRKEVLDEIFPDRPARIQDFTDHACWYNSAALEMLGVTKTNYEKSSALKK
jgi:predicted amidohydrolase YtcJ